MADFLHPADNVKKILYEGWKRFIDECDVEGRLDFYGLQDLACQEMIAGGETIARIRKRFPSDGYLTPLQIQMLEPEHLPYSHTMLSNGGNPIRLGIEFNGAIPSQRVAYHLYREHPGAGATAIELSALETTRVPAQFIVHAYRMTRAGQMRGEPWLSRALAKLYQFDQFVDATIGRQKLGAFMLGWVSTDTGVFNDGASQVLPGGTEERAPDNTRFGELQPETIIELSPNEKLNFFEQPDISTQYEAFICSQLREIFACAGMTLEQFDVSKVNYSSIRAGILKFRRRCEKFQFSTLVFQFCRPITNAWMDVFILSGAADKVADRLGLPRIQARDYYANKDQYQSIEWRTPGFQWIDPMKEVLATILEIRAGLKPLSVAIRERGYDPTQVIDEYRRMKEILDDLGLVFDTDASKTDQKGALSDPVKLAGLLDEDPPPPQELPESNDPPPSPKELALVRALMGSVN
jgi:lambda family phage portal protein